MIKLLYFMLTLLLSENISPKRLEKESKSTFELFCERIAPYVLFFALVLLGILLVVILVKYGANITGTEQNIYYYHLGE